MNQQPCLQERPGYRVVACPVADEIWETGLYLPSSINLDGGGNREGMRRDRPRSGGRKGLIGHIMGIYDGHHAELYDLFYGAKPYADEASYLHSLLQQIGTAP